MANLGSDLSQLFSHLERGEQSLAEAAAVRARGIVRELFTHPKLHGGAFEVSRLGEIIDDALKSNRVFSIRARDVDEYFLPYALHTLSHAHVH
jgi:hypothetical protein